MVRLPAAARVGARTGSLPAPLTLLIGHERGRADLRALLHRPDMRLVTLTGAEGSGKTRLALAAAADVTAERRAECGSSPPASIRHPALAAAAIATTQGARGLVRMVVGPGSAPRFLMLETVHEYARERLRERGAAELQWRHAEYRADRAETAELHFSASEQPEWLALADADQENVCNGRPRPRFGFAHFWRGGSRYRSAWG